MNGRPARYAIRIAGRLGATSLEAFPDLHWEARGSDTVLTGEVRDGSALYGVIALLESLGLELIEVKPLMAAPSGPAPSSGLGAMDGPESGTLC
jgi:hypothetical protein